MPKNQKTIGLTLGGGGAKGYAHIGVYKVLQDHQVPIDYLTGCSMGAVIAAAIAQGKSPEEIYEVMKEFGAKHKSLLHVNPLSFKKGSLLSGKHEAKTLRKLIPPELQFEDLKIPLKVNAVDIEKGGEVVFSTGSVYEAVLASAALPGLYPPVFKEGRLLVDGGLINNIPVNHCRNMGADYVIAVDLKSFCSEQNISGLIYHFYMQKEQEEKYHLKVKRSLLRESMLKLEFPFNMMVRALSIAEELNTRRVLKECPPNVLIHPDVSHYSMLDIAHHEEIYTKGIEAAKHMLPQLKKLLA